MGIEKETFDKYGPTYLKDKVDWSNRDQKRAIAAALVWGVKVLDRDRVKRRHGLEALAPPWWQSLGFDLFEPLKDPHDHSYFGAIFKLVHTASPTNPSYVVAFRGTINRLANVIQDYTLDAVSTVKNLENRSRVEMGVEAVHRVVGEAGHDNRVWVAGYSLGAAIALAVGREMVKRHGMCLQTYLFSPPFPTLYFGYLSDHMNKVGEVFRVVKSLATVFVVAAVNLAKGSSAPNQDDNSFAVLSAWAPFIFINARDPISSKYVRYFKHREDMERRGLGHIERLATQHTIRTSLLLSEPLHLIPSAHLFIKNDDRGSRITDHDRGINQWWSQILKDARDQDRIKQWWKKWWSQIKGAHGISQWWTQDVELNEKYYNY